MSEALPDPAERVDHTLKKLHRSTSLFSSMLVLAVAVVFASSVWTNYKVITLTAGLKTTQAHLAKVQRDDQARTRTARVASCKQFNVQQTDNIAAQIQLSHDFVAALTAGSTNPATLERARMFNERHDALIVAKYPLRDCTAAGIAQYLGLPAPKR